VTTDLHRLFSRRRYAEYALAREEFAYLFRTNSMLPRGATALRCIIGFRSLRVAGVKPGDRVGSSASAVRDVIDSSAPFLGCEVYVVTRGEAHVLRLSDSADLVGNEDADRQWR